MKEIFKPAEIPKEEKLATPPRVVGGVSEKIKEQIQEKYLGYFYEDHLIDIPDETKEELKYLEYEKQPYEKELIEAADNELNDMMEKLGIKSFGVSEKNIHIVPPETFKKIDVPANGEAVTVYDKRAIIVNAGRYRKEQMDFGMMVFHEMFHLKGYFSLETEEEKAKNKEGEEKQIINTTVYRAGLGVYSAQKKHAEGARHSHFTGLEEAVAAEMEKGYFSKIIKHPVLKEQKGWIESEEAIKIKKEISQDRNIPIEDIFDINKDEGFSVFSYPAQRKVLNLLILEIYNKNKDKFNSQDEVLDIFVKAHFTGELLPMARLIKNVFGNDAFEMVGTMTGDKESAVRVSDYLERRKSPSN